MNQLTNSAALGATEPPPPASQPASLDRLNARGIWRPGVVLMHKVGFASKAFMVTVMFLLPIAWLAYAYFSSEREGIAFAQKERDGVRYVQALYPELREAVRLRDASLKAAPAVPAAASAALQGLQSELGKELGTGQAWAAVDKARAEFAGAKGVGLQVFTKGNAYVQALTDLFGQVADGSGLTLDPEIDSYYLMDAAVAASPPCCRNWGRSTLTVSICSSRGGPMQRCLMSWRLEPMSLRHSWAITRVC